tara:strand:+ start:776 stop:1012 length:237 start_codon:yes stop_codon:yes gene_type:complete
VHPPTFVPVLVLLLPLELKKDREAKSDQAQAKRVFSLNQASLSNLEEFLRSLFLIFLLSVIAQIKELIHEQFSRYISE